MNRRKLLLALQRRNKQRLNELRRMLEKNEVRAEDIEGVQTEVQELADELQNIADELANMDDNGEEGGSDDEQSEGRDGEEEGEEERADEEEEGSSEDNSERNAGISPEQRSAIMTQIGNGLSTRGHRTAQTREREMRAAFANFVVGRIGEEEARSLGLVTGNGSVVVPEIIASEVITYAQEENLLRKYGSIHRTVGDVKYPVLVTKANANVTKTERATDMGETTIEFDEILLSPAEFDALATVTKKLINMTGVNVENIVIEELKKAYVRKETAYMFKGNDEGNENAGSLYKKAVQFEASLKIDYAAAGWSQKLYSALVRMKNTPTTEVLKKSMWIVNRAALTKLEDMTDTTGRPLLHEAKDGVGYTFLGHKLDFTDEADGADKVTPHFYFGDFKSFHVQEVIGSMEIQKLVEKYAAQNKVGFKIYNLLDGQLIYSPLEPTVYRFEATQSV